METTAYVSQQPYLLPLSPSLPLCLSPSLSLSPHRKARVDAPPHEINPTVTKSKYDLFTDHTQRETDPLAPYYFINGSSYSDIDKNHPTPSRSLITDNKLLHTADIEGAQAGYILHHRLSIPEEARREYRNINYLDDIPGAHADTVKHSIHTTRVVNPLVPQYQSLDGREAGLLTGPCEGLVPARLIDQQSDFKTSGTVRGGRGGHGGGERTLPPTRHNLFSRSGSSVLLSPAYPPLSPCRDGGGAGEEDNHSSSSGYYTYHYDDATGSNGIALSGGANELSLTQSRSYAEKYFPPTMDLLSPQGQPTGPSLLHSSPSHTTSVSLPLCL
jgi:hypothetical protein